MLTAQRRLYHFPIRSRPWPVKPSQNLRNIAEWCCSNKLLINPTKTEFMIFGMEKSIKNLPNLSIPFLGKILTPVTVCKDLGLTLDATLTFNRSYQFVDVDPNIKSVSNQQSSTLVRQECLIGHGKLPSI